MLGLEDASLGVFCPCVCKPSWFNSNSGSAGIPKEKSALVSFLLDENQLPYSHLLQADCPQNSCFLGYET